MKTRALSPELLHEIDANWRAANYLSVGQIDLYDNPLLEQPLKLKHVKPLVVGHSGARAAQDAMPHRIDRDLAPRLAGYGAVMEGARAP